MRGNAPRRLAALDVIRGLRIMKGDNMSVDEQRTIDQSTAKLHQPRVTVFQFLHRPLLRMQKRRAERALHRLDDWYLEDMGIQRGDIPRVVEDVFQKPENGGSPPVATRSWRTEISKSVRDVVDAVSTGPAPSGRHG